MSMFSEVEPESEFKRQQTVLWSIQAELRNINMLLTKLVKMEEEKKETKP